MEEQQEEEEVWQGKVRYGKVWKGKIRSRGSEKDHLISSHRSCSVDNRHENHFIDN